MTVREKLLPRLPILDGNLIENVSLTAGQTNVIEHGLGRQFRGVLLALNSANANVWFNQAANSQATTHVHVQCSANCIVSLWIF